MVIEELRIAIDLVRKSLAAIKAVKDMIPDAKEKEQAAAALDQAEQGFRAAEAQVAHGLGYQLHRCTWPPQIMLEIDTDIWQCPACGKQVSTKMAIGVVSTKSSFRKRLDRY